VSPYCDAAEIVSERPSETLPRPPTQAITLLQLTLLRVTWCDISLSHLVARRTFFLPRASPPKILGAVRGLLTNIESRNLHSIARNY
jgi:hypothetical protein